MDNNHLWTSMFSPPFADGETEPIERFDNDNGNENDENSKNGHGHTATDDDEEQDDDEDPDRAPKPTGEPDDDAIFDFELEPIVSIAEPTPPPMAPPPASTPPASAAAMASKAMMQRQSLPAPASMRLREYTPRMSGAALRPTTSQINATDENGVPINYELGVIYICPACGSEYRQQDLWKRHMNQMHQYNTRRGLNFVAIDKLYHRCLECNKHIAMHSRENLLKHKFTHLPFRCTKCYLCKREYKYRQDLMVHLRMMHCDEVISMMRGDGDLSAGKKTRVREPQMYEDDDCVEVKNEVLLPDPEDQPPMYVDDEQSCSSTSAKRKRCSSTAAAGGSSAGATEICEDYIHYMCPDCGTECDTHAQWSQHIEFVHDYVSRRGLNFRCVDMQMQCIECKQFIQPNTIKTLRQHKFSHLPNQEWLRCKLCYTGFADHQLLVNHLLKKHHLDTLLQEEDSPAPVDDYEGNGTNNEDEPPQASLWDDPPRRSGRHISPEDIYEPHIDYLCPQCGKEFMEKRHWRTHVVQVHDMNDLAKLNFELINDRQLKCTECEKIITNAYGIQNAQQHRITHLPHKAYARCRKCHKSYTDRKGLVKHLATYHRVGYEPRKVGGHPVAPNPSKQPRRQIVTVANETYEIIYLDDEESANEENDFGEQMQAEEPSNHYGRRASAGGSYYGRSERIDSANRYKCVDCGSLFATQLALKKHISEEHDFTDTQYSAKKFDNAEPTATTAGGEASTSSGAGGGVGNNTVEKNYIFLCPSCGEEYKTQFEWRRHINEAHNFDKRSSLNMRQLDKYRYQCIECKDIVTNSKLKGLQDHHFRHLPYRLYLKCLICGTCYNHKPNIAAHLRTRHNILDSQPSERESHTHNYNRLQKDPSPISTSNPGRSLKPNPGQLPVRPAGLNTLEDSISYHNAVDLDFITYYCPKCNKNFDSHAFWRKHIVEHHNYNSRDGLNFRQIDNHHYLCLECYKRVTVTHTKGAIGQLQSHKFRHLPYRSFKCLTCNGEFVRKQMFFKHLNRDTNRCDNKPTHQRTLREPHDDEAGDAEVLEPLGNASTANESHDAEVQLDPSTYRLMCPQCGDEFSTKALWRKHINIHHALGKRESLNINKIGDAQYQCIECEETLHTNKVRVLQQHHFTHLPYADYIRCQLCDNMGHGIVTVAAGLHSMEELQQHMFERHPAMARESMQIMDEPEEEENEEEEGDAVDLDVDDGANDDVGNDESNSNGPYMPLPLHLLDDDEVVDDLDFDEQYLLG